MIIVDYIPAKECKNKEVIYTCLKCGKCGRRFECGIMVDDGGTTVDEEEYEKEEEIPFKEVVKDYISATYGDINNL